MFVREDAADRLGLGPKADQAQEMFDQGHSNEEVFDQTGFFAAPTGRLTTQIDDSNIGYNLPEADSGAVPLDQAINHEEFFEAYPGARDWTLEVTDTGAAGGVTFPDYQHVAIDDDVANGTRSDFDLEEVGAHELQHVEQTEAGIDMGGGNDAAESYSDYREQPIEEEAFYTGETTDWGPDHPPEEMFDVAEREGVDRPSVSGA